MRTGKSDVAEAYKDINSILCNPTKCNFSVEDHIAEMHPVSDEIIANSINSYYDLMKDVASFLCNVCAR